MKRTRTFVADVVGCSLIDNRFFYAPRGEVIEGANGPIVRVTGKKIDITKQLQKYLLKRYRQSPDRKPKGERP